MLCGLEIRSRMVSDIRCAWRGACFPSSLIAVTLKFPVKKSRLFFNDRTVSRPCFRQLPRALANGSLLSLIFTRTFRKAADVPQRDSDSPALRVWFGLFWNILTNSQGVLQQHRKSSEECSEPLVCETTLRKVSEHPLLSHLN